MEGTIRITCKHQGPMVLEDYKRPTARINGEDSPLSWSEPTEIRVPAGQSHHLNVYLDILGGACGADIDIDAIAEGETQVFEYYVSLEDRVLSQGELRRVS